MIKAHQENKILISVFRFQFSIFNFLLLLQPISLEIMKRYARLAIGNVGNFWIIMQESNSVRVYSVDCVLHLHYKVSYDLRLKNVVFSATLLLYVFSSLRHGEQTTVAPDTD